MRGETDETVPVRTHLPKGSSERIERSLDGPHVTEFERKLYSDEELRSSMYNVACFDSAHFSVGASAVRSRIRSLGVVTWCWRVVSTGHVDKGQILARTHSDCSVG